MRAARRPESAARQEQARDAERRNQKRHRIGEERPVVAELGTLAPPRNVPIVSVVQPVVWVSELAVCSSSRVAIDGRIAARPAVKNGEAHHEQSAQHVEQPGVVPADGEDEQRGDDRARIRSLAIMMCLRLKRSSTTPASRPDQHRRDGARQHHAADHQPGFRRADRQAEHGDVVEVVAHFADHLADPQVPVVVVVAQ